MGATDTAEETHLVNSFNCGHEGMMFPKWDAACVVPYPSWNGPSLAAPGHRSLTDRRSDRLDVNNMAVGGEKILKATRCRMDCCTTVS